MVRPRTEIIQVALFFVNKLLTFCSNWKRFNFWSFKILEFIFLVIFVYIIQRPFLVASTPTYTYSEPFLLHHLSKAISRQFQGNFKASYNVLNAGRRNKTLELTLDAEIPFQQNKASALSCELIINLI